jgi:hypothetical protein
VIADHCGGTNNKYCSFSDQLSVYQLFKEYYAVLRQSMEGFEKEATSFALG